MPVLRVAGADLHYETFGKGKPFLFMSQTAGHGEQWKLHQVPEFSRDHQVIVYDQRGTGKSTAGGDDFTTKRLAEDAAALLDHIGAKGAIVCGHSNGGRVAQLLTLDHPDKVSKLILASSGGTHTTKGIPIKMCVELVEVGYPQYVRIHSLDVGFTKEFREKHPDKVDAILSVMLSNPPTLENFLGHVVGRQTFDGMPRLKDIRVPTLVLIGDDEDHGSSHGISHMDFAGRLAKAIPGAKLVVIPGQGHYYPYAAPDVMHKIVREFLAA